MSRTLSLGALALALAVAPGCMSSASMNGSADAGGASAGVMVGGAMMLPSQTLVENASGASNLTTLVSAVQAAELVETLSGDGPFTVFAPTNTAFGKVPESALNTLLMPENQAQLQGVLTFHVVPGRLSAADLRDGQTLTTVNGETLTVTKANGQVMIGNANGMATVTQADVYASNGVAHVIDSVLMP
ncbi:fasciclin domain-containing protein [Rubrivirga marina]|uniref:FAS1 domain-containing protein n=1 Tax=Rubrivirga marina TaxID=1196024 RepID=A0A271J3K7_9BACT|nr:fasciclin domain-containing protein [Rubrivirga marina]PAP78082.1 hypothetical protein BSZ37_17385 [Rubrivirga marina]